MKLVRRFYYIVSFLLYYLWEVLRSNISIAADILTPTHNMYPAIVDIVIHTGKEHEILTITNLTSMTPGTLALDYDRETKIMKVHVMYFENEEKFRNSMDQLQRRIQRIFNG